MGFFQKWFEKKGCILIIDDNEQISSLLSIYLKAKGYSVECANNGLEGVSVINKKFPSLVLLDITMPKMDGFETLLSIKSNIKTKHIPVVMCTDHTTLNDVEKCCKWGADGYVLKPFDLERVLEKIRLILGS